MNFHLLSGSQESCASKTSSAGTPLTRQSQLYYSKAESKRTFFFNKLFDLLECLSRTRTDLVRHDGGNPDGIHFVG